MTITEEPYTTTKLNIDDKAIGARLRQFRQQRGHSAASFAEAAGLLSNVYLMHESGRRPITIGCAAKLYLHHKISLNWLFFGDGEPLNKQPQG